MITWDVEVPVEEPSRLALPSAHVQGYVVDATLHMRPDIAPPMFYVVCACVVAVAALSVPPASLSPSCGGCGRCAFLA